MPDTLVNGTYPISYFSLPGVDEIQYPDTFWWSSKQRFAAIDAVGNYQSLASGGSRTSEVLEIDLGRIRELNFVNFDVLRAPIDIKIEYDALSTPDRQAVWVPVTPTEGLSYDDSIYFDTNNRTGWLNAEFNFTNPKGHMVHTRYLRITFSRRDEPWPVTTSAPFQWPVFVKHLRLGRYVSVLADTVGPLLSQDTPIDLDLVELETVGSVTREVRQQFVYPGNSARGDTIPSMLGFGVLVNTGSTGSNFDQSVVNQNISFGWSIWDVTNSAAPVQILSGIENNVITTGISWLDFYLSDEEAIVGDLTKTYELRIFSFTPLTVNGVYTHTPNRLSSRSIPGTLNFTNGSTSVATSEDTRSVVAVGDYLVRADVPDQVFTVNAVTNTTITLNVSYPGATTSGATGAIIFPYSSYDDVAADYVQDASKNLVMRVWADVADDGRDVLGNAYRYAVRKESAKYVQDNTKAGWMSVPVPTPDAVEALYFDIRGTDEENNRTLTLVEALRVAPRTPGVRMNVYYSQQGLQGSKPQNVNDWDYLLWTPIHETYTLRRDEIIQLPQAIKAAFVKLEFSALNPLPFRVPTYPPLPPRLYRRFPTWVEDQFNNSTIRNTIEDWFLRNATPVETKILQSLADPVEEFAYKQREFLAALALGKVSSSQLINSSIVDIEDRALIDPVTGSKVFIQGNDQYQNSLLISVDQDSILGKMVVDRFDSKILTDPIERPQQGPDGNVSTVSTSNDRITESYQNLAQTPMRFNQTCRHVYTMETAEFNKKAYFVGIDEVRFLRNDYTVVHDDAVIQDKLHDDTMLEENTWAAIQMTSIPDGQTLYVSYSVGDTDVKDEQVFFTGFIPVELSVVGAPPRNVKVFDMPNGQGVQYYQNDDYDLTYGTDTNGVRTTSIMRSQLTERLGVTLGSIVYIDVGRVTGKALIPSAPTDDAGVATGTAVISGVDGPFVPDYGAGTYGGGTYADMTTLHTDAATVVATGHESGVDAVDHTDSATATGTAVITATETYTP